MGCLSRRVCHKLSFPECGQRWAWQEACSLLLFSDFERRRYEEKVSRLAMDDTEFNRKCPGCGLLVQRLNAKDDCVECLACAANGGKSYQFCWSCTREWCGQSLQGSGCKRETCSMVALLLSCPLINNPLVTVNGCPVVRACPDCRALIAHAGGCKYVTCRNCPNRFCYRCLEKYTACYGAKPRWYHVASCAKPMAPRQAFSSS